MKTSPDKEGMCWARTRSMAVPTRSATGRPRDQAAVLRWLGHMAGSAPFALRPLRLATFRCLDLDVVCRAIFVALQ